MSPTRTRQDSGGGTDTVGAATGLSVYGLVPSSAQVPADLRGLDDSPLRTVVFGEVAALVGEIALDRPPGRRRELVAYTHVLDTVAGALPVVPVRFGAVLADEDSVQADLLEPLEATVGEQLARLEGHVQVTVRATWREDVVMAEVVASDPVIAGLRERTREQPDDSVYGERVRLGQLVSQALEAKRAAEAPVLLDPVLPLATAYHLHERGGVDHLAEAALLVDRDRLAELEELLEDLAEAVHDRVRVQLLGPMAAYDFAEEASWV